MSLFDPKPITMADLTPVHNLEVYARLTAQGSRQIQCFRYLDCYAISSIDPSGDNGEPEIHVSVSRDGRPCDLDLASRIGKAIHPHVEGWDNMGKLQNALHLWSKEVQP